MAMNAAITWEFRTTATGSMVNGGGFKTGATGTNYSLQDAAQLNLTDLACLNTTTNLTSVTGGFTAAMVGNVIHITAGTQFTVGWYEITAVTDANTAVIDRTAAVAGQNATGGTGYVGGALSLNSTLDDEFFDQLVAGQIVYFQKGTYTLGETTSMASTGTTTLPIKFIGYNSTRDDVCTGLNRPIIDSSVGGYRFTFSNWAHIKNIHFIGNSNFTVTLGSSNTIVNCKINNISTANSGYYALGVSSECLVFNCEAIAIYGRAISAGSGYCCIYGCYVHNSDVGIYCANNYTRIINNIIANNMTYGIKIAGAVSSAYGNTIYGSEWKVGTGIDCAALYDNEFINNNIYGFVTGTSCTAADKQTYMDYNNIYNCTTPVNNHTELANDVAFDPVFVNAPGTLIQDCEAAWDEQAIANVTASAEGTIKKVGSYSAKFAVGANFSTGIIGSKAITSTDMSSYNGISCWIYSSVALNTGDWQLLLDNTANCASPLKALNIPSMAATTWYRVYLDGGDMSACTAIISIGLNQVNDKGAMNFYIDDVRAGNNNFAVGTNLKALGYPGLFNGGTTTGAMDIGAVQRVEAVGSSSDVFGII